MTGLALAALLLSSLSPVISQETAGRMLALCPEGRTPAEVREDVRASGGRLGFLYFTTDWCGWCKKLQKDTFSDPAFIDYTEAHFLPYLVNAEKNTGPELRALYKVHAYPTVVIIDGQGRMIDMIIGYKLPQPYLAELARIVEGEDTLAGLREAYAKDPQATGVGLRLADKHFRAYEYEAARALYEKLRPSVKEGPGRVDLVLNLATIYSLNGDSARAAALLEEGLAQGLFTDNKDRVLNQLGYIRFREEDYKGALAMFGEVPRESRFDQTARIHTVLALAKLRRDSEARAALEEIWKTYGQDENRVYTVCWYLWDNKVFLDEALAWARRAAEMSKWTRPHIINVCAELLLALGKKEEALDAERKAVEAADAKNRPLYRTYLAALHAKAGDRATAEKLLAEIDGESVAEASTLNNMAWTCHEQGFGLDRALAWAERAVHISQYLDDNILSTYAALLQSQGRTDEAVEALTKAMAITTYEYRRKDYADTIARYKK